MSNLYGEKMGYKLAFAALAMAVFAFVPLAFAASDYTGSQPLFVSVGRTCYKEEIQVGARLAGSPASGAKAYLYSINAPRKLVSEITLNYEGKGAFSSKPKGKYEIIATYGQNRNASVQFEVRDCYYAQAPMNPPTPPKVTVVPMNGMTQFYDNGISRSFELIDSGGQISTRITLRYTPYEYIDGKVLEETVPSAIANQPRMIGFENAYPEYIGEEAPIALQWEIGKMRSGQTATIAYVVDREITGQMSSIFSKPALVQRITATNLTKNVTPQQKPQPPAPSSEAAMISNDAPDLPLALFGLVLAAILAVGAGYFLASGK